MSCLIEYQFKDFIVDKDVFGLPVSDVHFYKILLPLLNNSNYKIYCPSLLSLGTDINDQVLKDLVLDCARNSEKIRHIAMPTGIVSTDYYEQMIEYCNYLSSSLSLKLAFIIYSENNYPLLSLRGMENTRAMMYDKIHRDGKILPIHYSREFFFESLNWFLNSVFKPTIENEGLINDSMYDSSGSPFDEPRITSRILYPYFQNFFNGYNVQIENEASVSHGSIDFLYSHTCNLRGHLNKVCMEVKLGHHSALSSAPHQLKEYIDRKADPSKSGILLVLYFSGIVNKTIDQINEELIPEIDSLKQAGYNIGYHIINCTKLPTPSRRRT